MDILGFKNGTRKHEIMHFGYSHRNGFMPHELLFIEILFRLEFLDLDVVEKFVSYVLQYYPYYNWQLDNYDIYGMAIVEAALHEYRILQQYKWGLEVDREKMNHTFIFGEMATNFCIKYLGYSLIGCGGAKSILTSQDNYEKKFIDYIEKGYNIFKLSKLYYVDDNLSLGYFKELDSLPCHNNYYNNEYIEDKSHVFKKVY